MITLHIMAHVEMAFENRQMINLIVTRYVTFEITPSKVAYFLLLRCKTSDFSIHKPYRSTVSCNTASGSYTVILLDENHSLFSSLVSNHKEKIYGPPEKLNIFIAIRNIISQYIF